MPGIPGSEAQDTVLDNLGLDPSDVGLDDGPDDDVEAGPDGDDRDVDQDDGPDDGVSDRDDDADLDDMRLDDRSHTDRRREQPKPRTFQKPDVKADRQGNLRAPDGSIVARAGREARYYQGMFRARSEVNNLRASVTDHASRLNQAVEIGLGAVRQVQALKKQIEEGGGGMPAAAKDLGLSPAETVEALQMFHLGKSNPTELLKKILTRATVAGIDLTKLGLPAGTLDPKSLIETIRSELRAEMKPLTVQQKAAAAEAERRQQYDGILQETTREVHGFFGANPQATPFLPVFMEVMKINPKITMGEIWANIKLNLLQRRQRSSGNSGNGRDRRNLPNGRGSRQNGAGRDEMASLDASYDDILKSVVADYGLPDGQR